MFMLKRLDSSYRYLHLSIAFFPQLYLPPFSILSSLASSSSFPPIWLFFLLISNLLLSSYLIIPFLVFLSLFPFFFPTTFYFSTFSFCPVFHFTILPPTLPFFFFFTASLSFHSPSCLFSPFKTTTSSNPKNADSLFGHSLNHFLFGRSQFQSFVNLNALFIHHVFIYCAFYTYNSCSSLVSRYSLYVPQFCCSPV